MTWADSTARDFYYIKSSEFKIDTRVIKSY